MVVHAGCDKQALLMRGGLCGKLHGRPSQLLLARPAVIDPIARYWPRIAIFAYPTCIRRPRRNIAMTFDVDKLEWFGYSTVKKNVNMCLFISTEYTNVTKPGRLSLSSFRGT